MTAEIVNLRRARKAKLRTARDKDAAVNRSAFGRTKADKAKTAAARAAFAKHVDGHKRDRD